MRKRLKKEECEALLALLQSGLPLQKALPLLAEKGNEHLLQRILNDLEAGRSGEETLCSLLPAGIAVSLKSLLKVLPLKAALQIAFELEEEDAAQRSAFLKQSAYPLFLLLFSLTGLYLFDLFGFDTLLSLLKSFQSDLYFFTVFRSILRVLIFGLYLLMILAGILFLLCRRRDRQVFLYLKTAPYLRSGIWQLYTSASFISFWNICSRAGLGSRDALQVLRSFKERPLISFLAYHVDEAFRKGAGMEEAVDLHWLDPALKHFVHIALHADDRILLSRYSEMTREKLKRRLKRIGQAIQLGVYLFIGFLLIFIYQILFLPLQALSQL
ncbi:MAG: type II secretion system F family protein [Erysipelotrichaceae bacterium]|nr:type II secretion system F family protein [Erysipelotrichaceae bacterium]